MTRAGAGVTHAAVSEGFYTGKRAVVESLALRRPLLAVGDGSTDLAMRPVVDRFICFTGFVTREMVAQQADGTVGSFDELVGVVLEE